MRSPEEYRGEKLAPDHLPNEAAQRPGHIPGAANVPWAKAVNTETGRFLPADQLRTLYAGHGLTSDRAIVAYCRIGERSATPGSSCTSCSGIRTSVTTTGRGPSGARSSAYRSNGEGTYHASHPDPHPRTARRRGDSGLAQNPASANPARFRVESAISLGIVDDEGLLEDEHCGFGGTTSQELVQSSTPVQLGTGKPEIDYFWNRGPFRDRNNNAISFFCGDEVSLCFHPSTAVVSANGVMTITMLVSMFEGDGFPRCCRAIRTTSWRGETVSLTVPAGIAVASAGRWC